MDSRERRNKLIQILENSYKPISGSELAKKLGVSRQVIVQDVALLRAADADIISTNKGYVLFKEYPNKVTRSFLVKHSTQEIEEELCLIIDRGGRILDVGVSHGIYGNISTELIINNRQDVYEFVARLKSGKVTPLKELTGDIHVHTVEADSEEILDKIEAALAEKGYLYKE
ncbi:MAG: transcription repressor NadR [Clostridiales bacterium]|nr:transcription repressor NadR [Clostridiales bacterium]